MPEKLDLDPDSCYLDQARLGWYPSQHQNHVFIIPCWYRGVMFHLVHSAFHYTADFGNHVAICTFQPQEML